MKPALVLKEMRELKEAWRRQSFKFNSEQQKRYDELLHLRRERVKEMYNSDLVHKGGTTNK
jgi:hypothetical protein|tara:strand:+ start:22 stop:204 length:183 start_codon:yes stop_codon:yes gene_type:complete